ncbi:MAG: hypothetical protein QM723_20220 [Myxococcaceae bacterium]
MCGDRCAPYYVDCGSACMKEDAEHCGPSCFACPPKANAGITCVAGQCTYGCDAGFHDCSGSCLPEDANSCGPQCIACPPVTNGESRCIGGFCQTFCDTDAGYHSCTNGCVLESPSSCGLSCGTCPPPPIDGGVACIGGQCHYSCPTGQHACNGVCVDEGLNSCGSSCQVCGTDPDGGVMSCAGGACTISCAPGLMRCGAGCCTATSVVTGQGGGCALATTGAARCWGSGLLGSSLSMPLNGESFPVEVMLDAGFSMLARGQYVACGLDFAGAAHCWGDDDYGQLGNGPNLYSSPVPSPVAGLGQATQIASGGEFTLLLTVAGDLYGFGSSSRQELSFPGGFVDHAQILSAPSQVVQVAAGAAHACALISGGAVKCWGANDQGQVGNSASSYAVFPPVAVPLPLAAVAVAANGTASVSCSVLTDGELWCWGDNTFGQLGNGNHTSSGSPQLVVNLPDAGAVSVGYSHSCALVGPQPYCWGNNASGQLGDGTTTERLTPVPVTGLDAGVVEISCGYGFTCVRTVAGAIQCWGLDNYGQLGDGTHSNSSTPVDLSGVGP